MRIGSVEVGRGFPCRTVAEIGNAHNGDLGRALDLIAAAQKAGADFVKLQAYTPDELVVLRGNGPAPEPWGKQGWSMRDLYEKAQTPLDWLPALVGQCRVVGIPWFSSFFGLDSLYALEKVGCPAYKIAALDRKSVNLQHLAFSSGKPVLISTPDDQYPVVDRVVVPSERESDVAVLYCPPGYPQERPALSVVSPNRWGMRRYEGFSYHGTDPRTPALAAALGASLVECHFQLDDEPSELEANVSLTASQFREMVELIRHAETVL